MTVSHAAAIYCSPEDLLARAWPYLCAGLDRAESVVAVLPSRTTDLFRDALGPDAAAVCWHLAGADFGHLGTTYAALRDFVLAQFEVGARTRLVTESGIGRDAGRSAAYLRWEAISNELWRGPGLSWLCLYDRNRHRPSVLEQIGNVHPLLVDGAGAAVPSATYVEPDVFVAARPGPLSRVPPDPALDLRPRALADLPEVRHRVTAAARALGLPAERSVAVELATCEVVTNAVLHGRPPYRVRVWARRGAVVVRVDDHGAGAGLAAAGLRPPPDRGSGHGMWLARRLADVVHVGTGPDEVGAELQFPARPRRAGITSRTR